MNEMRKRKDIHKLRKKKRKGDGDTIPKITKLNK